MPFAQLLSEIHEQPTALERLLCGYPQAFEHIRLPGPQTHKWIGIGEGSSYNALRLAAPYIEQFTGFNQFTFFPEALTIKFDIAQSLEQPVKRLFHDCFYLAISQSGKTTSILNILSQIQTAFEYANAYFPLIHMTNQPNGGTLGELYDNHYYIQAGPEESIAATKSMTSSWMALVLFGLYAGLKNNWITPAFAQRQHRYWLTLPEVLCEFLATADQWEHAERLAQQMVETNQFVLLTQGPMSLMIEEAGLKLTETSNNTVWADNMESFKHGPKVILQGVGHNNPPNKIYVIPPDLSNNQRDKFFDDMWRHFAHQPNDSLVFSTHRLFILRFENSPALPDNLISAFGLSPAQLWTLPRCTHLISNMIALVAFQMLALLLAKVKSTDPNSPMLQKAVI